MSKRMSEHNVILGLACGILAFLLSIMVVSEAIKREWLDAFTTICAGAGIAWGLCLFFFRDLWWKT